MNEKMRKDILTILEYFQISEIAIRSKSRIADIVITRQFIIYITWHKYGYNSFSIYAKDIESYFQLNRLTIRYHLNKMSDLLKVDKSFQLKYAEILINTNLSNGKNIIK